MDPADYKLYRGFLSDSVRRSLSDCQVESSLPADIAAVFEKSPDDLVKPVVDVLIGNVLLAQGLPVSKQEKSNLITAAQRALQNKQTIVILTILADSAGTRTATPESRLRDGALLFCARGRKLLKSERYAEARTAFKRAIEIKKDAKPAWLGLAEALDKLGESEQAAEARNNAERL